MGPPPAAPAGSTDQPGDEPMKTHPATKIGLAAIGGLLLLSSLAKCQSQYLMYEQLDAQWEQNELLQQQMTESVNAMSNSMNPYQVGPYGVPGANPYAPGPVSPGQFDPNQLNQGQYPGQMSPSGAYSQAPGQWWPRTRTGEPGPEFDPERQPEPEPAPEPE